MKLAIACDHRGYDAKMKLLPLLRTWKHQIQDFGCNSPASCDYPDFAIPAGRSVVGGANDVAILLDGSGIGMSIVANKIRGIRAALAHDELTARRAREHNHCNALCLGTDLLGEELLRRIVQTFLTTDYTDGRHTKRVAKIAALEADSMR